MADRSLITCYTHKEFIASNVNKVIHNKSGETEILKNLFFKDDMKKAQEAHKEAEMMQSCSHRYIVEMLDCFIDGEKLCLVMKFYNDGDL